MVLAIGTLLDLDRQSHSLEASQYFELGRAALAVDSVFEEQSIQAIQALVEHLRCPIDSWLTFIQVLMCHYMFLDDIEGPRWATMGIVVKLAQSVSHVRAKFIADTDLIHRGD